MPIAGTSKDVKFICGKLQGKFEMVDLGPVSHFLGMVVSRDEVSRIVYLTQESYIGQVLEKFGVSNRKPVGTPMEKDKPIMKGVGDKPCDCICYLQLIGSLGWIATGTRSDIVFTFSYLGGETQTAISLPGFVNADFAGDASSLKSTSGYMFLLGTGSIQWHSKHQTITATSTVDAKFITSASVIQELVWFQNLIREFGRSELPISTLYNYNQASLSTVKDMTYKPHSKHIGIRIHQIREFIEDGKEVTMSYCRTSDMIADGLTKPLVLSKHVQFVRMCGLS